jgi:hypothetical protein
MAALDGPSTTAGGVLNGNIGRALVAGDIVLGAGWGTAPVLTLTSGSNGQRGRLTILAKATAAQATATIVLTFPEPYTAAPFVINKSTTNDNSLTAAAEFTCTTTTTTATFTHTILPVADKTYTLDYAFSL